MSKEKKLRYYDKAHTYYVGKKKLTSVTTFVKKFFPEFDAKEKARQLAKLPWAKAQKKGVRYWLKTWKEASEHGTKVHKEMEDFINGESEEFKVFEEKTVNGMTWYVDKFFEGYLDKLIIIPELKVYDEELGLAGTIDLFVNDGGEVTIIDWKTNKKISKEGYEVSNANEPVAHLLSGNYYQYSLQLSTYAYILERQGYNIEKLLLVHLQNDGVVEYEVDYLKKEVEDMLKWQRKQKNKKN